MGEIIKTALSEIEDTLVRAMNNCKDEYEAYALVIGVAAGFEGMIERVTKRWTPKQESAVDEGNDLGT